MKNTLVVLSAFIVSQAIAAPFEEKTLANVKDKLFTSEDHECPSGFKLKEMTGGPETSRSYAIVMYTKDKEGGLKEDGFEMWQNFKVGSEKPQKVKQKISNEMSVTKISSINTFGAITTFNVDYDFKGTKGAVKGEKLGLGGAWTFDSSDNTLSYAAVQKSNSGKIGIGVGKMCHYKISEGTKEISKHDGDRSSGKEINSSGENSKSTSKKSTAQ